MEKNGNMSILYRKNSCCIQNILILGKKKKSYLSHSENRKASKESGKLPAESETHGLLIHFRVFWINFFAIHTNSKLKAPSVSAYAMYSQTVEPTFK